MTSSDERILRNEQVIREVLKMCNKCPCCEEVMLQPFPSLNCNEDHRLCLKCFKEYSQKPCPQCVTDTSKTENASKPKPEPILPLCKYASLGCTYSVKDAPLHESECKFREYICPGKFTGILNCKWKGKLEDITNHFQDNHKDNIGKMSYQYTGLINLHKKGDIQLFDAHNKKFIFVYDRKLPFPCNSFIYIACMGTEQQAKRYCYELEFFKPADVVSSLKYRIVCVSDSVQPATVIQRNQCIFLCNNSIKHFINDDTLNFRFWVKQVQHVIDAKTNRKK
ncbi:E3 ubiquitin-protein ligase siah2-like [Ctenocephalides felis]|uniref:E3 ubiquitin-protein ligase siah2-like n=1 Tax=Ctenocephalides felis TaxID=7515 RepID=UPI000E6E3BF2|nr:E3 ubiquitin-protein ligase siah2-like [Ctenocephalides felis]